MLALQTLSMAGLRGDGTCRRSLAVLSIPWLTNSSWPSPLGAWLPREHCPVCPRLELCAHTHRPLFPTAAIIRTTVNPPPRSGPPYPSHPAYCLFPLRHEFQCPSVGDALSPADICLSTFPGPLAILIFGRDASLAIAAIYYRYASLPSPKTFARYWDFSLPSAEVHPTTVSKFNTFLQLALIGLTLLFPVLAHSSDTGEGHRVIDAASDNLAPAGVGAASTDSAGSPLTASSASNATSVADPASTISLESQQHESKQSTYTSALYAATDAGTLSTAVTALQILVGATTVWSGFSYAFLKDAVTILGSNEALKKKQGARGRAIIGLTFALVCISATGWAIKGKQRREEESQKMKNE